MAREPRTWEVRRATDEDEEQIRRLAVEVFSEQPPDRFAEDYWRWEFADGPAGRSSLWVADDDGKVVGHYAANPLTYLVNGIPVHGAIVVDVMSSGDYRNQGMFTALGRVAMREAGEDGIAFCLGYPVRPEVMPGHLKVGWVHAFDLPVYALPLAFEGALRRLGPSWLPVRMLDRVGRAAFRRAVRPVLRLLHRDGGTLPVVDEVTDVDSRFDVLAEEVGRAHRIVQRRDADWLRWRYLDHPRETYRLRVVEEGGRLVGMSVTRPGELLGIRTLVLVDLAVVADRPDVVRALARAAEQEAVQAGAELVATMMNAATPECRVLRSCGFLRTPEAFHLIRFANDETLAPPRLLDDKTAWWLTWGDTDVL